MLRLLDLRTALPEGDRWWNRMGRRLTAFLLGQVHVDHRAIARHYEFDHDLYLSYLKETRCYSQAVYAVRMSRSISRSGASSTSCSRPAVLSRGTACWTSGAAGGHSPSTPAGRGPVSRR